MTFTALALLFKIMTCSNLSSNRNVVDGAQSPTLENCTPTSAQITPSQKYTYL